MLPVPRPVDLDAGTANDSGVRGAIHGGVSGVVDPVGPTALDEANRYSSARRPEGQPGATRTCPRLHGEIESRASTIARTWEGVEENRCWRSGGPMEGGAVVGEFLAKGRGWDD